MRECLSGALCGYDVHLVLVRSDAFLKIIERHIGVGHRVLF